MKKNIYIYILYIYICMYTYVYMYIQFMLNAIVYTHNINKIY